jgi:hypothetical protein
LRTKAIGRERPFRIFAAYIVTAATRAQHSLEMPNAKAGKPARYQAFGDTSRNNFFASHIFRGDSLLNE